MAEPAGPLLGRFCAHMRRRPWIYLKERRVVGSFPDQGCRRGQLVLVYPGPSGQFPVEDAERCEVTRVDHRRNRIKVRPAAAPTDTTEENTDG